MSAYGAIRRPNHSGPLPSTVWQLNAKRDSASDVGIGSLTIHHLTLSSAHTLRGLLEYLHAVFADELERGLTYPQEILPGESYTLDMFEAYYFSGDVLVAVLGDSEGPSPKADHDGKEIPNGIDAARNGRRWEDCIAGCYYVGICLAFEIRAQLPMWCSANIAVRLRLVCWISDMISHA